MSVPGNGMEEGKRMKLSTWGNLAFGINSIIEKKVSDITFEDLYSWIEERILLEELEKRYELFGIIEIKQNSYEDYFYQVMDKNIVGIGGSEKGKVKVDKSGLSLFLALVIEAMQQNDWESKL